MPRNLQENLSMPTTLTPYSADTGVRNQMADDQNRRNNLRLHRILASFSEQFNAAFISVEFCISYFFPAEQSAAAIFPHAAFAFAILVILGLLQVKYQGKGKTPFETHPKTIAIGITSLLVYCLAYGIQLWLSSVRYYRIPGYARGTVHFCMLFAGSLSMADTASFLFPDSVRPFLFAFYFITSAGLILYRVYKRFQVSHRGWWHRPQFFKTTWLRLARCFAEQQQTLPL